ncbi:MAG: hypothetical protein WC779_05875 [Candidatus Omnitrophota bacterium]|jgi:predicted transcriptional regulator
MNHKLLVHEIDNIVAMLRDRLAQNAENAGYVLSESFFRTPDLFSTGFRAGNKMSGGKDADMFKKHTDIIKSGIGGAKIDPDVERVSTMAKKTERQAVILAVLRNQSNLTIRDFAKVIKDCSSKTIQRELSELVEKGIVKKEGERRWSRYSLS